MSMVLMPVVLEIALLLPLHTMPGTVDKHNWKKGRKPVHLQ